MMMSSCSPMLPMNGNNETLVIPAGAILHERYNRRKVIYYGCCPTKILLAIIIIVHTTLLAFWIIKEYYFFDFKCATIAHNAETTTENTKNTTTSKDDYISDKNGDYRERTDPIKNMSHFPVDFDRNPRNLEYLLPPYFPVRNFSHFHVGYLFDVSEFAQHLNHIFKQNQSVSPATTEEFLKERFIPPNEKYSKKIYEKSQKINKRHNSAFNFKDENFIKTKKYKDEISKEIHPTLIDAKNIPFMMIRRNNNHIASRRKIQETRIKDGIYGKTVESFNHSHYMIKTNLSLLTENFSNFLSSQPSENGLSFENFSNIKQKAKVEKNKAKNRRLKKKFDRGTMNNNPEIQSNARKDAKRLKKGKKGRKKAKAKNEKVIEKGQLVKKNLVSMRRKQSGESWEADDPKPTQKRFHFLSGSNTISEQKINEKESSWFHGIVSTNDKTFANNGDIRFYRGEIASNKPTKENYKSNQPSSVHQLNEISDKNAKKVKIHEMVRNDLNNVAFKSQMARNSSENYKLKKNRQRWKSTEDEQSNQQAKFKNREEIIDNFVDKSPNISAINKYNQSVVINGYQQSAIKPERFEKIDTYFFITQKPPSEVFLKEIGHQYSPANIKIQDLLPNISRKENDQRGIHLGTSTKSTNDYKTSPSELSMTMQVYINKERGNFIIELEEFSNMALCVTRALFDLWCVAECITAVPFLIGVWCPLKCLFAGHIILATLLIIIAFVYSLTIAVYSLILYGLIPEMKVYTILLWLGFAASIDLFLIVYFIVFIITLRCCDLVVDSNNEIKPKITMKI